MLSHEDLNTAEYKMFIFEYVLSDLRSSQSIQNLPNFFTRNLSIIAHVKCFENNPEEILCFKFIVQIQYHDLNYEFLVFVDINWHYFGWQETHD